MIMKTCKNVLMNVLTLLEKNLCPMLKMDAFIQRKPVTLSKESASMSSQSSHRNTANLVLVLNMSI